MTVNEKNMVRSNMKLPEITRNNKIMCTKKGEIAGNNG